MKKKNPIDELRKRLFDIEVSLYLSQEDMEELQMKLVFLDKLEKDLVYNINLHRSGTVTTSMAEYRLTLRDLKKTREELSRVMNLKNKTETSVKKLVIDHDYYNSQYEQLGAYEENNIVLEMEEYAKRKRPESED